MNKQSNSLNVNKLDCFIGLFKKSVTHRYQLISIFLFPVSPLLILNRMHHSDPTGLNHIPIIKQGFSPCLIKHKSAIIAFGKQDINRA